MLPPVIYLMLHSLFFTLRLSGGGDSFPRQAEEREVDRYGAEKGYLDVVCLYADDIYGENRAEAFELYRRPAKLGGPQAFSVRACPMEGVERDVQQAGAYGETKEKLRYYKKPSSASGCGGEFSQADRTAQERETEPFNGPSGPRRECAAQAFSP
mgnify:CR=1 FL=1